MERGILAPLSPNEELALRQVASGLAALLRFLCNGSSSLGSAFLNGASASNVSDVLRPPFDGGREV